MRSNFPFQFSIGQTTTLLISFVFLFNLVSFECFAQNISSSHKNKSEKKMFLVKKEDILSNILVENHIGPLYGRNGFIKKTIALNKSKINSNGEFNNKTCIRDQCFIELPFIKEPYYQKNQIPVTSALVEVKEFNKVESNFFENIVEAATTTYRVKKGDVLSMILFVKKLRPIYGITGYLKQAIGLNKTKVLSNGMFNANTCVGGTCFIQLPVKEKKFASQKYKEELITERAPSALELNNEDIAPVVLPPEPSTENLEPLKVTINESINPSSRFIFSPAISFLKVSSGDDVKLGGVDAVLLSKKGITADLKMKLIYSEKLTIFGHGVLDYHVYNTDPEYTFIHTEQSRLHFGAGAMLNLTDDNVLSIETSLRQKTFFNVLTSKTMSVESITTPEFSLSYEKYFMRRKSFYGKIDFRILGILPSTQGSFSSAFGSGFGTELEFAESRNALFVSYDLRKLKINNNLSTETSLLVGIKLVQE